ncbi:uncharacterized protein YozE (UPF0346 family) [Desulfosalsimonas propionicica]|uniref:Uncharacterized protein YozE (UPF0346 family) n=1 Tax=Desulfosalsimonas propionicica TaxID=332175 RepID=A0A7W0HME4_9BACT|nr:hypothetical protein [Desulfosalsimonas propionicica]MBA2883217.1 uncharacterized protein YozE (UPF0346 family) [Desulfosalsimonas propionicica]
MERLKQITSLASLAVFRELYNSQTDIYAIISRFLNEIISTNGKYNFTLTEITNLLNDSFGFTIPEAVVSTSLGRLDHITKERDIFSVDKEFERTSNDVSSLKDMSLQKSSDIVDGLINYIEKKKTYV